MNVWILNHYAMPPTLGGINRHHYMTKYMEQWGNNVRIFTASTIHNSSRNMIEGKELYKEITIDGVTYTYVRTGNYTGNGLKRIYNMIQFPIRLIRVCNRFQKPDVIYTSSPDIVTAFFALLIAKVKRVPCVVEVRDLWPASIVEYTSFTEKNPIIKILYQVEKWIYKKADKLIFTMEGAPDYIVEKGWEKAIDFSKIFYINNGVDIEEFDKNAREYSLEDEDLSDPSTYKVIYAGSIRPANDLERLVEAAEKFKRIGNDKVRLLIYGDGSLKPELEKECEKLGLTNIIFKGRVDKKYIPYILSKADLSILNYKPSTLWKFGSSQNKLFEYLASGKPVLSTIEIGYSVIKKYKCGIEVSSTKDEAIADAILDFYNMNQKEYEQMCKNARSAAEDFDLKVLAQKVCVVLQETLK